MTKYRTIEIDFEIYQLIVLEKRDFEEPDFVALRRLLVFPVPSDGTPNLAMKGYHGPARG